MDVQDTSEINGLTMFADAALAYLREIEVQRALCIKHNETAAIHDRGQSLQIYRLFKRDEVTARQMRNATEKLQPWEDSPYWQANRKQWVDMEQQVVRRMEKHHKQHPIITRGIVWEGVMPILVHAYKFEPDPIMKMELIVPPFGNLVPQLPLQLIAASLQCHEYLVPNYIAEPLPPYDHHEAKFSTLLEYLSRTMPRGLYASECLPSSIQVVP